MRIARLLLSTSICLFAAVAAFAQSSAFTYQGRLNDQNGVANGTYVLRFGLFDASAGGTELAAFTNSAMVVSNGLFVAQLDFGANAFDGNARWLEVAVQTNGGTGTFTKLSPRQLVTSTPYAIQAANASAAGSAGVATVASSVLAANVKGTLGLSQLPTPVVTNGASGVNLAGSFSGDGANVTNVNAATLNGLDATRFWQVGGNNVTDGQFIGSTNGQPLEFRVNGSRVLRLDSVNNDVNNLDEPNILAGSSQNSISGAYGATISGGGTMTYQGLTGPFPNVATAGADFSTIGGGFSNNVSGPFATIGGGARNVASGVGSVVAGGGTWNVAQSGNKATGDFAAIGGGSSNQATNTGATVPGGGYNVAGGQFSFAAGRQAKATNDGAFVWADSEPADYFSTTNNEFSVRASGGVHFKTFGTGMTVDGQSVLTTGSGSFGLTIQQNSNGAPNVIAGSQNNFVFAGVVGATIGGGGATNYNGSFYTNSVTGDFGTVDGGGQNIAGGLAVVGGGLMNYASAVETTISGGSHNSASAPLATVGGGGLNTASYNYATVGGGVTNTASQYSATVAGGSHNVASAPYAAVGGGSGNTSSGDYATVAGGFDNSATTSYASVGGGVGDIASGYASTVGGGFENLATNYYATVPGGADNIAGGLASFAAGQRAKALHDGSFVWSDSQEADFSSTGNDQFLVRAQGGLGINTATIREGSMMINTNVYLDDHPIYFRGSLATDHNHGLAYNGNGVTNFSGNYQIDGPVLWGFGGGVLGVRNGGDFGAVSWSRSTTVVSGSGSSSGGVSGFNEVVAQFTNTSAAHNAISVEASTGHDSIVYFAEGGSAKWGLRENHNDDSFNIRWHGNGANSTLVSIQATNGNMTVTGTVTANGVLLTSDRNAKENFSAVDSKAVLEKVASLPLTQWNYKKEDATQKHLGPMAQDFHAAFGLNGEDDKHISSVDEAGVALAAVQGLNEKLEETRAELKEREAENANLKARLEQLEKLVLKRAQ